MPSPKGAWQSYAGLQSKTCAGWRQQSSIAARHSFAMLGHLPARQLAQLVARSSLWTNVHKCKHIRPLVEFVYKLLRAGCFAPLPRGRGSCRQPAPVDVAERSQQAAFAQLVVLEKKSATSQKGRSKARNSLLNDTGLANRRQLKKQKNHCL